MNHYTSQLIAAALENGLQQQHLNVVCRDLGVNHYSFRFTGPASHMNCMEHLVVTNMVKNYIQ